MTTKLGGLAARLKAGIEAAAEARERAEREALEAAERDKVDREKARAARAEMMEELHAFAKAVGHFEVKKVKGALVLRFDGRDLSFTPQGEGDRIAVSDGSEVGHHLTRDSLGEWEVALVEEGGLRRLPLEIGLEELMAAHMALPTAAHEGPAPAPAPAPVKAAVAERPAPPPDERPARKRRESKQPPGSGVRELNNPWE